MNTKPKTMLGVRILIAFVVLILTGTAIFLLMKAPGTAVVSDITPTAGSNRSTGTVPGNTNPGNDSIQYGIRIALSEGQVQTPTQTPQPITTGEALPPELVEAIFDRLPVLPASPADQVQFKFPVQLLPPPIPGKTISEQFPPSEAVPTPQVAAASALEVLRYAPEGEIPIAPFVSVTFNQPMVPVGTLGDLAAAEVPLRIEPPLEGTWRWIGTRTLTFEYDSERFDRLPKATSYTVDIPTGTKSMSGGMLAEAVTWSFSTPAAQLQARYPENIPQPLHPLIFLSFDQRIDPASVLATIQVYAGNTKYRLVLASQAEIEQNEEINSYVKNAQAGRWLVFKAVQAFPADTPVTVTIGPGTPSAEGPLVTDSAQSFGFSTYAPLQVIDHECSWSSSTCTPLSPFSIRFNNPLDTKDFSEDMLKASPEIPGMNVNIYGDTIIITGETRGQTTYTLTLSAQIRDIFGQTLGKDTPLTFKVGKADAVLFGTDRNLVTLDPAANRPAFSVYAMNYNKVDVRIYSVKPTDWSSYMEYLRKWQQSDAFVSPPGRLVYDKSMPLKLPADTLSEVNIDLSPYLVGGFGQFLVIVEPPAELFESQNDKWKRFYQTVQTWVQVTHIGVDAYNDYSDMLVWTTDLRNGTPLDGVRITSSLGNRTYQTRTDGTARFAIPSGAIYLVASKGADQAILPHSPYYWNDEGWKAGSPTDSLRWAVYDDRQMYRPGEEVHLKGWLRRLGGKQDGDISLTGAAVTSISYSLQDSQGNAIGSGQADVNALGGFDFSLVIPETVNLGDAYLNLSAMGSLENLDDISYTHVFQIQEFRRPEFEVTARNETNGPYFAESNALVSVEAKYYAGGPLANAGVTWEVTTSPGSYSPPNWPDFTFGTWEPWWIYEGLYSPGGSGNSQTDTFTGKTNSDGLHTLHLDFSQIGDPENGPRPMSVSAQATVMDINNQAWAGTTSLLVHPADVYVGLRSDRYFVERGTPLSVDFIVTDLDGSPVENIPVTITAARMEWKLRDGNWSEEPVDEQVCEKVSGLAPDSCTFETPIGGSYRITAQVSDEQGRRNQSSLTRWVSGGQQPPARSVEQEQVTLIPDKPSYQPGDQAHILVQSPFSPAEGLLTVGRSGFLYTTRFTIQDGSTTLTVPIKAEYLPNLHIQVDLAGSAARTDDNGAALPDVANRPAYASGELDLNIPPLQRTLSLQVTPDQSQLEPGGETNLTILLKDADGKAVPDAELSVVVVDEAILSLTDYQMIDPLAVFYTKRPSGVESRYGRASIVLVNPLSLLDQAVVMDSVTNMPAAATMAPAMEAPAQVVGMTKGVADQQPNIAIRSDFNPLASFTPTLRTGSNGEARLFIRLPDNLTRYRVMVVAVDSSGRQFGTGEANLTARLPLMVRPSAPRFLNFGDRFELPIVLQNQTDSDMSVEVVARASNLEIGTPGLRVTVPANDRVAVQIPFSTQMAGIARIQVAAVSGEFADATILELPVYTPATSEAFAAYGVIEDGAISQPVAYPTGVFPQYGGLEINTSSTALQALTDAVLYLVKYPFEGSEQLASRTLAIAALRDVLTAFDADGLPSPVELQETVAADITRLQGLQNSDGGFPYWRRGFESVPFNSIHVAHALVRANQKGFDLPPEMLQGALTYLQNIESHYPSWYSQQTRSTLSAYALYVRNLAGERDSRKASRLLSSTGIDHLSMQAIGWLWPVIDNEVQLEEIRRYTNNHIVETAGSANFTTDYDDQTYLLLSSDRRTDAILLDALIGDNPQSDLIPKLVSGLLAHRRDGRWENTQENVFVLLALDRYFNTYETQTPDFVARLWLGDTYAGSSDFSGRTTDRHATLIPMTYVLSETASGGGTQDLIISKTGEGRLYYRIGLRYAPTDLQLDPLDMGFVVRRSYEALDNPDDVIQDSDGTWHIRAGARVRVHITMVADNRRYHVALVDPLPAGLEIINPGLAVSPDVPQDDPSTLSYGWWWWRTWYDHQNLRDDRAEAFTSLLWDGVYQYTYVARATTPGTFVVPPAKAEEMYSPEVFGRSGSDVVIVE